MNTTGNFSTVRLLNLEAAQLKIGTVTAVTFYRGTPPMEYIEGKLKEIFDKNPWIQGRLENPEKKLVLRYPSVAREIGGFLGVVSIPALRFDMGFAELAEALKDLVIKQGSLCLNKEEDLFRVTVVKISEDQFALVVSMSHVYADGYTFYEVHKMLSSEEPARPLIAERVYSFRRDLDTTIRDGYDVLPWLSSPGFAANVIGAWLRGNTPTANLFTINQGVIEEAKKKYQASHKPKFISANDVITSEFFTRTACDLVFMVVNFRERIPHITMDHAGNYEALVGYQREDFASPELIRQSLSDFRRPLSGKLPGFFRSTRVKLGVITNWATFYRDIVLPGCELLFHRPVIDPARFVPFEHTLTLFKSRQEQLSVITRCKEKSVLSSSNLLETRIV